MTFLPVMTAPSLTLRSLQNEETGIDISIPCFQEEEAPLGGVSILYEVSVLTKLDVFKTRLHKNEDVVQFSVYKAYREVEDLYNKLNKKYPKTVLPIVPKSSTIGKYTSEEKVAALDHFMKVVSKSVELCKSSEFTHFIGVNSQRLSVTSPNSTPSSDNTSPKNTTASEKVKDSDDLSNVFPKVKNVVAKTGNKVTEITGVGAVKVDLFEEVKLVKGNETSDKKGTPVGGLFDDFEDENLFSAKPTPKPSSPPSTKQVEKAPEVKPKKKEPEKKPDTVSVDDSQIIIKDRKIGDISLFDEQDFGDYVTQEEEALFLVTPDDEKSKKNTLLFSSNSETVDTDSELNEDLDDLLNLNPLPTSPASKNLKSSKLPAAESKSEELTTDSSKEIEPKPTKPIPLPRKKSLGKSDTDELAMAKPEVMPRKVFLTKPEVPSKPIMSSTSQDVPKSTKPPPISAKPVLPPKPKPPPKAPKPALNKNPKDLDALNANKPVNVSENQNSVSNLTDDLNRLDILKYIEQEQKTLDAEPSLFD